MERIKMMETLLDRKMHSKQSELKAEHEKVLKELQSELEKAQDSLKLVQDELKVAKEALDRSEAAHAELNTKYEENLELCKQLKSSILENNSKTRSNINNLTRTFGQQSGFETHLRLDDTENESKDDLGTSKNDKTEADGDIEMEYEEDISQVNSVTTVDIAIQATMHQILINGEMQTERINKRSIGLDVCFSVDSHFLYSHNLNNILKDVFVLKIIQK